MSVQVCPRCSQRGFTWYLDDEVGPLTQWHCSLCGYHAQEDESLVSACPVCGQPGMRLRLSDARGEFWFCLSCQASEPPFSAAA